MDRSTTFLRAAALSILVGCAAPRLHPAALDGTWTIASATLAGRELPVSAFGGSPLRLAGGGYTFQNDTGDVVLVSGSTPSAMDVRGRAGPNAGKTIPAIFALTADTLTICYDLSGRARPTQFRSEAGTQQFLVRYTRSRP